MPTPGTPENLVEHEETVEEHTERLRRLSMVEATTGPVMLDATASQMARGRVAEALGRMPRHFTGVDPAPAEFINPAPVRDMTATEVEMEARSNSIPVAQTVIDLCNITEVSHSLFSRELMEPIVAYRRIMFFSALLRSMHQSSRVFRNAPKPFRCLLMGNHLTNGEVSTLKRAVVLASYLSDLNGHVTLTADAWNFTVDLTPEDWDRSRALLLLIDWFGSYAADILHAGHDLILSAENLRDIEAENPLAQTATEAQWTERMYDRFIGLDDTTIRTGRPVTLPRPAVQATWIPTPADVGRGVPMPDRGPQIPAPRVTADWVNDGWNRGVLAGGPETAPVHEAPAPAPVEEPIQLQNIRVFHNDVEITGNINEQL